MKEVTVVGYGDVNAIVISIHTSVKEVTGTNNDDTDALFISIHTSVKEVTEDKTSLFLCRRYFNPHLREGGDLDKTAS